MFAPCFSDTFPMRAVGAVFSAWLLGAVSGLGTSVEFNSDPLLREEGAAPAAEARIKELELELESLRQQFLLFKQMNGGGSVVSLDGVSTSPSLGSAQGSAASPGPLKAENWRTEGGALAPNSQAEPKVLPEPRRRLEVSEIPLGLLPEVGRDSWDRADAERELAFGDINQDCDFDSGLCTGWSNGGTYLAWTLNSGTTPSGNTGPSGDHTSGSGKYYYTETSGGSNKNTWFELSVQLPLSGGSFSGYGVQFWCVNFFPLSLFSASLHV